LNYPTNRRLESLDALRGFDLLFLVAISDIMEELAEVIDTPWMAAVMECFTHKKWEGFSPWDLVMPLFMFMAGVAIPYSLGKYREEKYKIQNSKFKISNHYWRLGKRVLLLWIFGMMVQGNLMALDPDRIYLFTNTLQAIAVGYFFSALIYLHTSWKTQIGIAVALLLTFWGAMEFITIGSYGGGDYTPHGNLAEGIDTMVLGRFRDTAQIIEGQVVVKESYTYTWILSSLNFVVTVLSGVLAGQILKKKDSPLPAPPLGECSFSNGQSKKLRPQRESLEGASLLLLIGIAMVALGWTWGTIHPVIKHIWTGSMVLVSSGYCFLLMGFFYLWVDCLGHNKNLTVLKVYGMNSITAYVVSHVISFRSVSKSLFFGLEQYLGDYYDFILQLSNTTILFLILYIMYRKKIFLRV
jgi:predicted acyltransferase